MTKKDFVNNNKGIANGADLPTELLESLYDGIVNKEIKMESDGVFGRAAIRGWLEKEGTNGRWQRHWFVVANHCLYYFNNPEDKVPQVILPLEGCAVREKTITGRLAFELYNPSQAKIKSVKLLPSGAEEGQHKQFVISVDSHSQMQEWIQVIESNIVDDPIQQLVNAKMQKLAQTKNEVNE